MEANWSKLPTELLELILNKLTVIEIVCFEDVCSSWKKVTKSYTSSPCYTQRHHVPLLMLPIDNEYHFIGVMEKNNMAYKVKNKFQGFPIVGSSYGWLAILDETVNPHLFNPFSNAQIQLPLMNSYMIRYTIYIDKLVLSSDPSRSKDFSAAALIYSTLNSCGERLAFCKLGDKSWTWSPLENLSYKDITCYNGQIYAISDRNTVDIWDFHRLFPTKELEISYHSTIRNQWMRMKEIKPCEVRWKTYLVESLGELLIVERMFSNCVHSYITIGFVVSKLDCNSEKGCNSLETFTDRAIFVGDNKALSVSTRDFPNLKENSIYFIENYLNVYNLEEGRVSMCDSNVGVYFPHPVSFWMVPNPW